MGWRKDRFGNWVQWGDDEGGRADRGTERWAGPGGGGGRRDDTTARGKRRTREREPVLGGGGGGPGGGGYGPGGGGGAGMPDWWQDWQGPRREGEYGEEGETARGYYVRMMSDPVSGFSAIYGGTRPTETAPVRKPFEGWDPAAEGAPTYAEGESRMRALMGAPEYQTAIPDQWRVRQMAQPQIEAQAAQTGRLLRELGRDQGFGPGGGGAALRQQALAQVGGGAATAMQTAQTQLFGAEQARTQAGLEAAQTFAGEAWGTEYKGAHDRFVLRQEQRYEEWSTQFGAWNEMELAAREDARLMWDTWARLQADWKKWSTPQAL